MIDSTTPFVISPPLPCTLSTRYSRFPSAQCHAYASNWSVPSRLTSRPAAYQDKAVLSGFAHSTIEALDATAIEGFLAR